jgi:hypothetical protein
MSGRCRRVVVNELLCNKQQTTQLSERSMSESKTSTKSGAKVVVVLKEGEPSAALAPAPTTGLATEGGAATDHGGNKKRTTSEPPTRTLDDNDTTETYDDEQQHHHHQQDHAKKQRKEGDEPSTTTAATAATAAAVAPAVPTGEEEPDTSSSPPASATPAPYPLVWDLESALHQVITNYADNNNNNNNNNKASTPVPIEYLDDSKTACVTFRLGHAGDASTLAALYRASKARSYAAIAAAKNSKDAAVAKLTKQGDDKGGDSAAADGDDNTTDMTQGPITSSSTIEEAAATKNLEAWLADGLGDDNKNPPCVFALLAEMECTPPDAEAGASAVKPVCFKEQENDDGDAENENKEKTNSSPAATSTIATSPKRLVAVSILTIAPPAFHNVTGKTTSTEHEVQLAALDAATSKAQQERLQLVVRQRVTGVQDVNKRHLRVEWLYTVGDDDHDGDRDNGQELQMTSSEQQRALHKQRLSMCEKRLFLRLAALAVMTKSQLILVDHDDTTTAMGGGGANNKGHFGNSSSVNGNTAPSALS